MQRLLLRMFAVLIVSIACAAIGGMESRANNRLKIAYGSYTAPFREAKPPVGWQQFCTISPSDCDVESLPAASIRLDDASWKQIDAINKRVNHSIVEITDMEHYGVLDWWTYPDDGKGDCEDLQLLKRRMLISSGYPRQALMMTVVRDEQGEGHAVLMVRTDHGDFILDNKTDEVKNWQATAYDFYKRQSQENPNEWVLIRDSSENADLVVSGLH